MLKYAKKVVDFSTKDFWSELSSICVEANVEPRNYIIFKDTGGCNYVLNHLTSDLYLSDSPIDRSIRSRLRVLNDFIRSNIMDLRGAVERASGFWAQDQAKSNLTQAKNVFLSKYQMNT